MKKNKHGEWNPGDLIIFEATGEWCVLQEKFDIYAPSEEDRLEKKGRHSPSWAWNVDWGRKEGSWSRMDAGANYGISHLNLSNCAQPAYREGNVVSVRSSSPYKKQKVYGE